MESLTSATDVERAVALVDELAAADPDTLGLEELRELLAARRAAGEALVAEPPPRSPWPPAYPDCFPDETGLPEIQADELTADAIGGGILHHGALLVRGLLPADAVVTVRDSIDKSLAAYQSWRERKRQPPTGPWYQHFEPRMHPKIAFLYGEAWLRVVDAPAAMSVLTRAFHDVATGPITEYLGERPMVGSNKWTLRRTTPDISGVWHQDGQVLGDTHTVNCWVAINECGVDAPGLDVIPRRFDRVLPVPEGSVIGYAIAEDALAEAMAPTGPARPVFEPGDTVLLDELTVHNTGLRDHAPLPRYAIESWFFGPSAFPPGAGNVPILF